MDSSSSFDGVVFDPSKCSNLTMEEKREFVYQLSKWSHGAPEMLQSWSRQEILQILCAEMGKERKYTGLTKLKIIENLLKVVAEKNSLENETTTNSDLDSSHGVQQRALKRQRKTDQPIRLPVAANHVLDNNCDSDMVNVVQCKNSACKAKLSEDYAFCKRCSCCICHQYDDNKDPSLWLACCSDPPYPGDACGLSCHLECALKHHKSGIGKDELDGRFICVSCRKVNDLLGCLRKQLMIAKETRRVDILCYRLSLSQKLLADTTRYIKVYEMVGEAVKLLEAEFGPLTGLPVKKARGIVNRLSSGPEVQRLCASAMESLESKEMVHVLSNHVIQESKCIASDIVQFGDVTTSSVTVRLGTKDQFLGNIEGYTLWHRKAEDADYPTEPTCTLFTPKTTYLLSGLSPATDHIIKVVCFDSFRELGNWELKCRTYSDGDEVANAHATNTATKRSESPQTNSSSLSNPSSVEDETNNVAPNLQLPTANDAIIDLTGTDQGTVIRDSATLLLDEEGVVWKSTSDPTSNAKFLQNKASPETSTDNGSNTQAQITTACVPFVNSSEADLPITPFKLESFKDVPGRKSRSKPNKRPPTSQSQREKEPPQDGSSSKKREAESQDPEPSGSRDLEYYVKVIRWLECDGHVEASFRQKFLTWYSLRATPQEVRVVKVFVDTLIDDPASLAGQLVDTFSDVISNKRCSGAPSGFCLKLWH